MEDKKGIFRGRMKEMKGKTCGGDERRNKGNKGNKGNNKFTTLCDSIIVIIFKLPVNNITNNITELNINS